MTTHFKPAASTCQPNHCGTGFKLPVGKRHILALVFGLAGITGCSDDNIAEQSEAVSKAESEAALPSIYVDRTIENVVGGVNKQREGYRHLLQACQEAGRPTSPLSADEEQRIGTTRWQYWRQTGHLAYKVQSWSYSAGDITQGKNCHFTSEMDGYHAYYDKDKTIWLDLDSGERKQTPAEPERLRVMDASPDSSDWQKWSKWGEPSDKTIMGQPCKEWRSPLGDTSCIWAQGTQWGYSYMPQGIFGANAGFESGIITLEAEPSAEGAGDRLTTTQFVMGKSISPEEMMP